MSQPEEEREKSAKTDPVLRPPAASSGRARPRPPHNPAERAEDAPAPPTAPAAEGEA